MNDKPIKLILNLAKFKLTIVSDARASQAFWRLETRKRLARKLQERAPRHPSRRSGQHLPL